MHRSSLILLAVLAGCGGGKTKPHAADDKPSSVAPRSFEAQASAGAALYGTHCARCHGDGGQGTKDGPAVVGQGVLPRMPPDTDWGRKRAVEFKTGADVFAFVRKTMPGDDPGSLTDQQYVDILAFDLKANGVTLAQPLGLDNAATVVLNP